MLQRIKHQLPIPLQVWTALLAHPSQVGHLLQLRTRYSASWRWIAKASRIHGYLSDAEADCLFTLARSRTPEGAVAVEIGSWQGKSSVMLGGGLVGKRSARLHCVDPFEYTVERQRENFERNIRECGLTALVVPIAAYSQDAVRAWKLPIDLLFIDADHEYDGVRQDFLQWSPFVKPGGVIAFHDFAPEWPGVQQAVRESFDGAGYAQVAQVDSLAWGIKA